MLHKEMTFFYESINPTGSIPKPQVLPMFYQPLWCCTTSCIGFFMVCQLVLILQYIIAYSWNLPDWDYLQKMRAITFLPRSWDGKFPLKYGVPRFPVSGKFIKLLRVSVVLTFIILTYKIHHGGISCFGITKINCSQSVASHLLCMRLKKYLRIQQFTNFCNLKQTEF